MTILDSILGAMGTPDPEQQMEEWSRQQSAKNRAAIDPNNPTGPPLANVPGAAGTSPATTTPPGQVPNNAKSDPDMGALIGQLARREQANQGFNQALGMGFGAFAQPRDREAVDRMFNVQPLDASKIGESIMAANSAQQGQGRMNQLGSLVMDQQHGPDLAKKLNITWDELKARYLADPAGVGHMIEQFGSPTDAMKDLQQIDYYTSQVSSMPGHSDKDLATLSNAIKSKIAGPEAMKMVFDQINYRNSHGGKDAPWANNIAAYNQHLADDAALSKNIDEASGDIAAHSSKIEMLRDKISGLQNDPDLARILALPQDSPMKQAFQRALASKGDDWRGEAINAILINDPGAMRTLSELKEINGQEYANSIDSLLGHGLRPSQTEVGAVREGMGQTKNITHFGNIKDYTEQAIKPMLTRLDEAEATAYGAANAYDAMPARLRPFVHKVYLPGGGRNKEGSGSEGWAGSVHKQLSEEQRAALEQAVKDHPESAFDTRDQLRRQGYDVG